MESPAPSYVESLAPSSVESPTQVPTPKVKISLNREDHLYRAGQTIFGNITFQLTKKTKIRDIKVQIIGKGKCKWIELLNKNAQNRSIFYSNKQYYCNSEDSLPFFSPNGIELEAGEHVIPFTVKLRENLPSSFKGEYGSIKYKLRISIYKPWCFTDRHFISIKVMKYALLPRSMRQNMTPLEKQMIKTMYSIFGSSTISMVTTLPEDCCVNGYSLNICVRVENRAACDVEKVRFEINQYVCYFSEDPIRIRKIQVKRISRKEAGSIEKKTERLFDYQLLIPMSTQPTDVDPNSIINLTYELRVEAIMPGFVRNIVICLPFKIYSDYEENSPEATPRPSRSPPSYCIDVENISDTNSVPYIVPVTSIFPLDYSVPSPSHSSAFSETRSYGSTISAISNSTLVSSSESECLNQRNPSSRCTSHTDAPYTPETIASLPSPPTSISTPTTSTPPYSAFIFSDRITRDGAHDMPPTYEELFGNASNTFTGI